MSPGEIEGQPTPGGGTGSGAGGSFKGDRLLTLLVTSGGLGFAPVASGTVGTLGGVGKAEYTTAWAYKIYHGEFRVYAWTME